MKNTYSKEELDWAYKLYTALKEDSDYRDRFSKVAEMKKELQLIGRNYIKSNAEPGNDYFTKLFLLSGLSLEVKEKWNLRMLIDPDLKIKREDFDKPIRTRNAVAKIIYAFGIDSDPALIKAPEPKKTVSKDRLDMELRVKKFFAFTFNKKKNKSYSYIGRFFNVNKDTIENWIKEVREWPENEKIAVLKEFASSKNIPGIDVFDKIAYQTTDADFYTDYGEQKDKIIDDIDKTFNKPQEDS